MIMDHKDSMDIYASGNSELLYEVSAVGGQCANVKFSAQSKFVTDSEFLINCHNCQFCFACIGIENKKYCIFNKQYAKEEFFKTIDEIKSNMLERGEYGEFLPYILSPFAYNGSEANLAYPLDSNEIKALGACYQDEIKSDIAGIKIIKQKDIPDSIKDVRDEIVEIAIICEESGKPYRIIKSELEFYKNMNLPIPFLHPLERMKKTFEYLSNNLSYYAKCGRCGIDLETIYATGEYKKLYCETCFQKEVY